MLLPAVGGGVLLPSSPSLSLLLWVLSFLGARFCHLPLPALSCCVRTHGQRDRPHWRGCPGRQALLRCWDLPGPLLGECLVTSPGGGTGKGRGTWQCPPPGGWSLRAVHPALGAPLIPAFSAQNGENQGGGGWKLKQEMGPNSPKFMGKDCQMFRVTRKGPSPDCTV